MQLSLEDNDIDTLAGVAKLTSLMELYMGNNRVSTLREAQHLKDLPKLIILDLCGNPLCLQPEYRLYLIFYVRRLKVRQNPLHNRQQTAAACCISLGYGGCPSAAICRYTLSAGL